MFAASSRLSCQMRLIVPSGWEAIQGKNWSVAFFSSLTLDGLAQVAPPSFEKASLTSELTHGGRPVPSSVQAPAGKSIQTTSIVPSGAIAAVGKLLERKPRLGLVPNWGSAFLSLKRPGLGRPAATSAGALHVVPPSIDRANRMLNGPVREMKSAKKTKTVPSGATTGRLPEIASGNWALWLRATGADQVVPPSRETTTLIWPLSSACGSFGFRKSVQVR